MSTFSTFKINGKEVNGIREFKKLGISINFDNDTIEANITLPVLSFVNEANQLLDDWENSQFGLTEGQPLEITIQSGPNNSVIFEGYIDHSTREVLSSVESTASVVKTNGLNGFDVRSQGITMLTLENSGIMPKSLGVNIPCITESRNTKLEKLQLLGTTALAIKSAFDEIFKIINIASDITSAGLFQAAVNLAVTLANLVLIVNRIATLIKQTQIELFPKVFYHRGIKLITFLEKGCEKMGYTLDTGDFKAEFEKVVLCPHKRDETGPVNSIGQHTGFLPAAALAIYQSNLSGILKPNDFGYRLSDAFELTNRLFYTKVAIIGNTVKLLPFNDPFWVTNPAYTSPDIRIEQSPFTQNGIRTTNLADLKARTLIQYTDDDSDKWTISNVNNSVSETIVEQITVGEEKNVILKGIDLVDIPYSLCIRKDQIDDLFDLFKSLVAINNAQVQVIRDTFDSVADLFSESMGQTDNYVLPIFGKEGAMKIENEFFSTPKIVYLENNKIPSNFNKKIGAPALYKNFHSYKSFVPGVRDPSNPNNTNQKLITKGANTAFGPKDFDLVSSNSFFNTADGGIGKFTDLDWVKDDDKAVAEYYIEQNYMTNLKETTL